MQILTVLEEYLGERDWYVLVLSSDLWDVSDAATHLEDHHRIGCDYKPNSTLAHQLPLNDHLQCAHLEVWPDPLFSASKRRGGNDS